MAKFSITRVIFLMVLFVLVIIWVVPLGVTLITALKSQQEAASTYPWNLPQHIALSENLTFAWERGMLGESFVTTLVYATVGAISAIVLASLAAYAMVQLRLKYSFFWFLLIYSGTIFPFQMYLLPLFYFYQNTSLYDTQAGLLLFYTAIAIPFCLFVLRNHFTTISTEVIEAAKIDGLSNFGIYLRICMRLSFAPIAALFLFQFTWIWNDLLFGITLAKSADVRPIMAGLAGMRGIYASQNTPGVLAGALIASVPTILIFLFLYRYLVRGLTLSASEQ